VLLHTPNTTPPPPPPPPPRLLFPVLYSISDPPLQTWTGVEGHQLPLVRWLVSPFLTIRVFFLGSDCSPTAPPRNGRTRISDYEILFLSWSFPDFHSPLLKPAQRSLIPAPFFAYPFVDPSSELGRGEYARASEATPALLLRDSMIHSPRIETFLTHVSVARGPFPF